MASSGQLNGIAAATAGAGVLLVYAGLKGKSLLSEVQSVIRGKSPSSATAANPITASQSPGGVPAAAAAALGSSSPQQALQNAAAAYGWGSGAQWQALQNVEMAEAGFDPGAVNPTSGAYGLAQALGHGQGAATQGTVANEYGGYGLSDGEAQAANSGDAGAQAVWMCQYIAATYGTPEAAWSHEQEFHWY